MQLCGFFAILRVSSRKFTFMRRMTTADDESFASVIGRQSRHRMAPGGFRTDPDDFYYDPTSRAYTPCFIKKRPAT